MSIENLTGIYAAFRNHLARKIIDINQYKTGFIGLLAAMEANDQMLKGGDMEPVRFNREMDTSGRGWEWDAMTGRAAVTGVDNTSGTLSDFVIANQTNFANLLLQMDVSSYHGLETVKKSNIIRHSKGKGLANYIDTVAGSFIASMTTKWEADLFPADNVENSSGSYDMAPNKLQAVAYPLMADNAGATNYEYATVDMNAAAYSGLKAVVSGTLSTSFGTPTPSNIRTKLLMPLNFREGSTPDIGLCDSAVYDFMLQQAEAKVVLDFKEKLGYGSEIVRYLGLFWVPLYRLDVLASTSGKKREIMILSSQNHVWKCQEGPESYGIIDNVPNAPGLVNIQGYTECAYINTTPRFDARGLNVAIS